MKFGKFPLSCLWNVFILLQFTPSPASPSCKECRVVTSVPSVLLQPQLKWDVVAYGSTIEQREMEEKARLTLRQLRPRQQPPAV